MKSHVSKISFEQKKLKLQIDCKIVIFLGFGWMCFITNFTIAVIKIFFGTIYFNECPTNIYLPIYAIVGGKLYKILIILFSFVYF